MIKVEDHIITQTESFIAINKPSGLLTIPDREGKEISLKIMLKEKYGEIYTVHRLDKETSGVVVFARTEAGHKHLSMQFENRETKKIYTGLVLGTPTLPTGTINAPIGEHPRKKGEMTIYQNGKESITEYRVVTQFKLFTYMQFQILTGRTHQIRIHMKYIGNPIACDSLYGDGKPIFISQLKHHYKLSRAEEEERPMLNRLALHSKELNFVGLNNENINLQAPIPKDISATLNQLSKWSEKR